MEAKKRPASFSEITELRKLLKIRNILQDQMSEFTDTNVITCFEDLDPKNHCPSGFQSKLNENSPLFFPTCFWRIQRISNNQCCNFNKQRFTRQATCNGCPLPLRKWFIEGRTAKLSSFSRLENFPSYIVAQSVLQPSSAILGELRERHLCHP